MILDRVADRLKDESNSTEEANKGGFHHRANVLDLKLQTDLEHTTDQSERDVGYEPALFSVCGAFTREADVGVSLLAQAAAEFLRDREARDLAHLFERHPIEMSGSGNVLYR